MIAFLHTLQFIVNKLSIIRRIVEIVVKQNKKPIEIYHRKVFQIHKPN